MTLPRPTRWFIADDVLTGKVDLAAYPFRYVYLTAAPTTPAPFSGVTPLLRKMDTLFTAVEFLETRGWEVVNFEHGGQTAYMRRAL